MTNPEGAEPPRDVVPPPGAVLGAGEKRTTGRSLGLVAVIIMGVFAVLPVIIVLILMVFNELFAYYFILVIPLAQLAAVAGFILSIIGAIIAVRRSSPVGWPAAGLVMSIVIFVVWLLLPI